MRIVLDTNVWISAWLWGGIPSQILILCQEQRVMIFASPALLQEFEKTLSRPKFQKKIKSLNSTVFDVVNKTRELITLCSTISVDVPELCDHVHYPMILGLHSDLILLVFLFLSF